MLTCSKPSLSGGLARFYLCGNIPVCILSDKMRKNIVLKDFPMWILSTEQPYPLTLTYTPRRDTHYEVSRSFSQRNAKWRGRGYLWTKARACHTASACFCLDPVSLGSVFFNCLIVINLVVRLVVEHCLTFAEDNRGLNFQSLFFLKNVQLNAKHHYVACVSGGSLAVQIFKDAEAASKH